MEGRRCLGRGLFGIDEFIRLEPTTGGWGVGRYTARVSFGFRKGTPLRSSSQTDFLQRAPIAMEALMARAMARELVLDRAAGTKGRRRQRRRECHCGGANAKDAHGNRPTEPSQPSLGAVVENRSKNRIIGSAGSACERGPSGREPSGSTRLSGRAARLGHEDRWKPKTTIAESDERPTSMDGGRGRFVLEKGGSALGPVRKTESVLRASTQHNTAPQNFTQCSIPKYSS